jgi:hypothetical protein
MGDAGRRIKHSVKWLAPLVGIISASQGQPANAGFRYCSQPTAPSLFTSKPSKPYCAATSSCKQWEVDLYSSDIDQYFSRLKKYLTDVDQFQVDAYDYAKCMVKLD